MTTAEVIAKTDEWLLLNSSHVAGVTARLIIRDLLSRLRQEGEGTTWQPPEEKCPTCGGWIGPSKVCLVCKPPSALPATVQARIKAAGTGWCQFTHQHDNRKAAVAAAIEALTIAKESVQAVHAVDKSVADNDGDYGRGLADGSGHVLALIDALLSALSQKESR